MSGEDVESASPVPGSPADAARATAAARWLIEAAAQDGLRLTRTSALARTAVREAGECWPDWWETRIHGQPNREADVRLLEELHAGRRRLRLVRRRGRRLHATVRGREPAGGLAPVGLTGVEFLVFDARLLSVCADQMESVAPRGTYPRVLARRGTAPPQYPPVEDE